MPQASGGRFARSAKAIFGDFIAGGQLQSMIAWWLVVTAVHVFFIHYSRYGN